MSKALIDRLRRARQTRVPSQGRNFTVRRPTDLEMTTLFGQLDQREVLARFVIDWHDITEMDLVPGGGPDPVPFSTDLWVEWIADHPEHWEDLSNAVIAAYREHQASREAAAKNSAPGSAA